jgi:hypothetical protein
MQKLTKTTLINNCLQIWKQKYPTVNPPLMFRKTKKEITDLTERIVKSKGLRIKATI